MPGPTQPGPAAAALVARLRAEGDPVDRSDLSKRYGIHTDNAYGIPMKRLLAIAKPLHGDHALALALWDTGSYEARTVAALIDDPAAVGVDQMNSWCRQFDNWAIVDTTCFHLFDRTRDAWSMVEPWTADDAEFVRRAGFALLWALALHDRTAPDSQFTRALTLVEGRAGDPRPLVGKSMTMALRAIATKRPDLTAAVVALAERLVDEGDRNAQRMARPILKAFGQS